MRRLSATIALAPPGPGSAAQVLAYMEDDIQPANCNGAVGR